MDERVNILEFFLFYMILLKGITCYFFIILLSTMLILNLCFCWNLLKRWHVIIWGNCFYKSVEEKLSLAQEDLISNRNQIGNQNKLIQELKTAKATLEQDSAKREQQLKEQCKALQDIQKEKVFHLSDFSLES